MSGGLVPDEIVNTNLDNVGDLLKSDLCYTLAHFIHEIKKIDGIEYLPNTLREIIVMVQMYLNEHSIYWKLLDEQDFVALRNVVDNTMKARHSEGLGARHSSEVISVANEDLLFNSGVLGDDSPLKLLRTTICLTSHTCAKPKEKMEFPT